jgi:hypothetical protein
MQRLNPGWHSEVGKGGELRSEQALVRSHARQQKYGRIRYHDLCLPSRFARGEGEEVNYFTKELIERGRSKDRAILNRQEEQWDEACERYFNVLDTLKTDLPPGLKRIVESYYLHDAIVRSMGEKGDAFLIVVQLDTPPRSLLTFTYDLVKEPMIDREALPEHLRGRGELVEWQYDELERSLEQPTIWMQSILFSNGWEVTLHFRDVAVMEMAALLPVAGINSTTSLSSTVSRTV